MSHLSAGPEYLQWRRSNWTAYGYCLVVALGAVLFGFDQAAISGIIAIQRFQEDFGEEVDPATDTWAITAGHQTLLYAMLLLGAWVASIASGPLGTTFGRKAGLYCCAVSSLIGPIIQIVAPNMGVEAFGRVFSGMGIGFASNFCGTYWSEITPARYRGMVLMLYQGFINLAAFVGAAINQGVHDLTSKWAWRTPLFMMMLAPLVLLVMLPLLPESPRWYITRGRQQEARAALGKVRGRTWPTAELDREIEAITAMYEFERVLEGSKSYKDCFRQTDARRTRIAVLLALSQVFTGISFIIGYGVVFFTVSGVSQPFLITVITCVCGLGGSLAAFPLVRWFGRRTLLLTGLIVCGLCMLLFAIIGVAKPDSPAAAKCLVAFVCIYDFTYGATWGPVPLAVLAEVPSNGLRSKTISIATTLDWTAAMFITCGSPYLISPQYANIGTKMGFIFGGCMILSTVWAYFDLPETKDRTLEEIDEMFLNRIPARKFRQYVCTGQIKDKDDQVLTVDAKGPHVTTLEATSASSI